MKDQCISMIFQPNTGVPGMEIVLKRILSIFKWFSGIIFAICMLAAVLITSIEIAVYADYGYFRKEYEKYRVNAASSIVNMGMEELMDVTKEMMSYLKGDRDNLVVYSVIDGVETEFFNDREKLHMADCRELFKGAIIIRRVAIAAMLLIAAVMCLLVKNPYAYLIGGIRIIFVTTIVAASALAICISLDFTEAFTRFHLIFFNNDMWLLNPDTDRLINIVPEGFFTDTAIRIGIIFAAFIVLILVLPPVAANIIKKIRRSNGNGFLERKRSRNGG